MQRSERGKSPLPTPAHMEILEAIATGASNCEELARRVPHKKIALGQRVTTLVEKGFIHRGAGPGVNPLKITQAGLDLIVAWKQLKPLLEQVKHIWG